MRTHLIKNRWVLAALFILPAMALSLAAQRTNSLIVPGQPGSAKVIRVGGRNYVDVEGLARLTNGSISFNGNQIVLNLPEPSSDSSTPAASDTGFSKEFVSAAIEAMAQLREWHATLRNAIQRNYPITEDWLTAERTQAERAVRLAAVAASTTADKNAAPFLTNEFNNMRALSDKYLQIAASRTNIPTDALGSDDLDQRIRACARSVATMATTNQLIDDGSCQ
jgi:hypothetical protein